uniref:Secreted protein n=1 Tax=Rhipicephalus appendiculatus TaxID=34631 RepID=A0A131Y9Y3_RHIAP
MLVAGFSHCVLLLRVESQLNATCTLPVTSKFFQVFGFCSCPSQISWLVWLTKTVHSFLPFREFASIVVFHKFSIYGTVVKLIRIFYSHVANYHYVHAAFHVSSLWHLVLALLLSLVEQICQMLIAIQLHSSVIARSVSVLLRCSLCRTLIFTFF